MRGFTTTATDAGNKHFCKPSTLISMGGASDGSTVDYVNGFGIDDKLRQTSSASPNSQAYYLQDHLGSTIP
jgi:hypothetical protein